MTATLTKRLFEKLTRKAYREAYVAEHVRTGIAYQIRALRDQRGWTQKKLSEVLNRPQSVVCRLEDPDYGKLSVQTLLNIASAFDVALLIKFVTFSDFLLRTRDVSPGALVAESFDPKQLKPLAVVVGADQEAAKITIPYSTISSEINISSLAERSIWSSPPYVGQMQQVVQPDTSFSGTANAGTA